MGYANFSIAIVNEYFTTYFDRAADLANQLRDGGYVESFVYTTHPWLVSLYLDCPPHLVLANIALKVSAQFTQVCRFTCTFVYVYFTRNSHWKLVPEI